MDAETLKQFVTLAECEVPGFSIAFKDESRVQKALGFLVSPFNPKYMLRCSSYFRTVYFPSRSSYLANPNTSFSLLAGEFVHVWGSANDALYLWKYLCPQVLAVIFLGIYAACAGVYANALWLAICSYVVGAWLSRSYRPAFFATFFLGLAVTLACSWHFVGSTTLVLGGIVLAGPWPSQWRTECELNNYTMNVALVQWFNGSVSEATRDHLVNRFVGAEHYFMCSDRLYVQRRLDVGRQQAQAGVLQRLQPFGLVWDFLYWRRLLHRMRQRP